MSTTEYMPTTAANRAPDDPCLTKAIREYVRAFVYRHGRRRAAEAFAVSRHTLWRLLRRGHTGRSLPKAVINAVGESVEDLEAATLKLGFKLPKVESRRYSQPSPGRAGGCTTPSVRNPL